MNKEAQPIPSASKDLARIFCKRDFVLLLLELEKGGAWVAWLAAFRRTAIMEKQRRQFSSQEKVKILREHLIDKVPVSQVCEKHQIQPTLFYQWPKTFFENGTAAFERRPSPPRCLLFGSPSWASPANEGLAAEGDRISEISSRAGVRPKDCGIYSAWMSDRAAAQMRSRWRQFVR